MKVKTTELDKMAKVHERSQAIGAFLDWLGGERDYTICELGENGEGMEEYFPVRPNIEKLLAEYFDIDLEKVEKERRKLLDSLQKKAAEK